MSENRSICRSATGASILAVIILTSIGVYGNAIFNGFVVDDMHQVVENPWIRDVSYLKEICSSNVWAFEGRDSNYYRPLMHVAYMGVYHLVGLHAWGFHLLNALLHAGATALVFLVGSRLFGRSEGSGIHPIATPALVAALLFATHPVHTEAVAWVAGRTRTTIWGSPIPGRGWWTRRSNTSRKPWRRTRRTLPIAVTSQRHMK